MPQDRSPHDNGSGRARPRVLLINPINELVSITNTKSNWFNRFRVWKPLGLMVLAARTPGDWDVEIVDENTGLPDYSRMARPDLVGLSAFTSQSNAAYDLAARFKAMGVPVVMGGVHATMRLEEALERVDTVVTGEGDDVWEQVLEDARRGALKQVYEGGLADMSQVPPARHDLLPNEYFPRLFTRLADTLWRTRRPYSLVVGLGTGLSYRFNRGLEAKTAAQLDLSRDQAR